MPVDATRPADRAVSRARAPAPPLWWIGAPVIVAAVLIGVEVTSDADRVITRLFADPNGHGFPLRASFWLEVVMHQWAKYAVITLGALVASALVLSYIVRGWREGRRILVFLLLAMTLAPLSVTLGKAASSRHCPWDVDEFGGVVPYTRFFEAPQARTPPGHCFPAGHASTGFALFAFYFGAYAQRRRQAARCALLLGIAAGFVLGFGRVLQGAHFTSHVFWSGVTCWTVMLGLYALTLAGRPLEATHTAFAPG